VFRDLGTSKAAEICTEYNLSVRVICKLFYDWIVLYDTEQQLFTCVLRTEQRSYICKDRVNFKKSIVPVKIFLKFR